MFGFIIGALCLGGLAAVLWSRPRHRGYGHGCHGHGYGHGRGRYGLYAVLDRLDAAPGQEKAVLSAIDELRESAEPLRARVAQSRSEIASALRADQFDERAVDDLVARHSEDLAALGSALGATLGKIHQALDPEQRKKLARILESDPGFGFA